MGLILSTRAEDCTEVFEHESLVDEVQLSAGEIKVPNALSNQQLGTETGEYILSYH